MGCSSSASAAGTSNPGKSSRKVTFGYWNVRGGHRGNGTRYILNYCKVPYTEKTYTFGTNEWPEAKPNLGMEFPNLPYIKDGDFKVTETLAVQQYIAMKWKPELLGATP